MSKRDENYYFQNFVTSANCALRAAQVLKDTLMDFHPSQLEERLSEMHAIENEGDSQRHEMLGVLAKEFIAPIEREDIILLSQNIDDVTDVIEDVLIRAYINNIPTVRPEALQFSDLLIRCCQLMVSLLEDFSDFKHSKTLSKRIVEMNALEEEGDRLFIRAMHRLHTTCSDPLEVIAWREIFIYLERCTDACEHAADVVASVILKNT